MSNYNHFMKENKKERKNLKYKATRSLMDENGEPLEWTIKPITTREENIIIEECLKEVKDKINPKLVKTMLDNNKYIAKSICMAVVEPNLNNKELQDSYGVMSAEDLIVEMIDNYAEYEDFYNFIKLHSRVNLMKTEK